MNETSNESHRVEDVQEFLQQVRRMLDKHALLESISQRQEMPRADRHRPTGKLPHKRQLAELREKLAGLHPADIARILEALPMTQRLLVWDTVKPDRDGAILIGASDTVRASLIAAMSREELRAAAAQLDTDGIADLAPDLPQAVMRDVFKSLPIAKREQLRAAMTSPEDAVGALMGFDMVSIREDVTLGTVTRYLRRFDALPDHTDQLFVVDRDDVFKGVLPLNRILVNEPGMRAGSLMLTDTIRLQPDEKAARAAQAFARYGLVSAPVVDEEGKLVGRVTVKAMMGYICSKSENAALNLAGLRAAEDVFAPLWKSARNRWLALALNLCAAFFASRVIGGFEHSIAKLVALAALMPIVASIAGNSANQTAALVIRSLAPGRLAPPDVRRLIGKELAVAALNGLVWGGMAGLFAYALYKNVALGLVMGGAMLLNLLLGALAGILIPLSMGRMGRDPATGSGVMLAAVTDSGGFFIFLGLATLFLIH